MAEEEKIMSEEEMAAAFEAMSAAPAEGENLEDDMAALMAAEGGVLSQDEIDSLLGFGDAKEVPTSGIRAIIERSSDNYEKFPMLEVIFDRFSRSVSTSLRSLTGENADITIENITSIRFEDYLNSVQLPTLMSIFQAVEWENFGLMTIESSLTYKLIDILLGGGKSHAAFRVEGRPFTAIEQDIIKNFSRVIFEDLTNSFTPITSVNFKLDRLENNPRFATITRPANPIVLISARIEFEGHGGKVDIIFPYSTLEPVKDLLMQMFAGESFGADISWETYLSNELKNTKVNLQTTLSPKNITLKDLAALKVGSTLIMNNKPTDDIPVTCNGVKLFSGRLGAIGDKVAICATDVGNLKKLL
jgi:flagellar motor switch protein FliM